MRDYFKFGALGYRCGTQRITGVFVTNQCGKRGVLLQFRAVNLLFTDACALGTLPVLEAMSHWWDGNSGDARFPSQGRSCGSWRQGRARREGWTAWPRDAVEAIGGAFLEIQTYLSDGIQCLVWLLVASWPKRRDFLRHAPTRKRHKAARNNNCSIWRGGCKPRHDVVLATVSLLER